MNSFVCSALAAASLFLVSPSFANELFRFPEGDAAWTVEVIYPEKAPPLEDQPGQRSPNPARAKTIRVTRIGAVQRAVIAWSDGKITERWMLPKLAVILESDPRNDSVVPVESGSLRNLLLEYNLAYDRSAFDWIKPQLLQNPEPVGYRDNKCFLYKGGVRLPIAILNEPATQSERQAWIDSETLLPVALNTGAALCVFTFQKEPPQGPLEPPEKFRQEINNYKKVMGTP